MITAVDASSDAFRESNLRRGMVITGVNGNEVESTEELERIYDKLEPGESFLLRVVRADGSGTMVTALTKPE